MSFFEREGAKRPPMENLELLRTAADEIELSMIRGLLDENGIAYLTRERDGAAYLRVMAGYSMFGVDIYVDRDDLARAGELLDVYLSGDTGDAEDAEDAGEEGAEEAPEDIDAELSPEEFNEESAAPEKPSVLRRLVPVIVAIVLILIAAFAVSRA